jgi:hypothetical protein
VIQRVYTTIASRTRASLTFSKGAKLAVEAAARAFQHVTRDGTDPIPPRRLNTTGEPKKRGRHARPAQLTRCSLVRRLRSTRRRSSSRPSAFLACVDCSQRTVFSSRVSGIQPTEPGAAQHDRMGWSFPLRSLCPQLR